MKLPYVCASFASSTGERCRRGAEVEGGYCFFHRKDPLTEDRARERFNCYRPAISERIPDYRQYVKSEEWAAKKQAWREAARSDIRLVAYADAVLSRPRGAIDACWICGCEEKIHFHHLTYDRVGSEDLQDLVPLCGECHYVLHKVELGLTWK